MSEPTRDELVLACRAAYNAYLHVPHRLKPAPGETVRHALLRWCDETKQLTHAGMMLSAVLDRADGVEPDADALAHFDAALRDEARSIVLVRMLEAAKREIFSIPHVITNDGSVIDGDQLLTRLAAAIEQEAEAAGCPLQEERRRFAHGLGNNWLLKRARMRASSLRLAALDVAAALDNGIPPEIAARALRHAVERADEGEPLPAATLAEESMPLAESAP